MRFTTMRDTTRSGRTKFRDLRRTGFDTANTSATAGSNYMTRKSTMNCHENVNYCHLRKKWRDRRLRAGHPTLATSRIAEELIAAFLSRQIDVVPAILHADEVRRRQVLDVALIFGTRDHAPNDRQRRDVGGSRKRV